MPCACAEWRMFVRYERGRGGKSVVLYERLGREGEEGQMERKRNKESRTTAYSPLQKQRSDIFPNVTPWRAIVGCIHPVRI